MKTLNKSDIELKLRNKGLDFLSYKPRSEGEVIYALKKPNFSINWFGFHELFHAMTAAAFICHFIAAVLTVFVKN